MGVRPVQRRRTTSERRRRYYLNRHLSITRLRRAAASICPTQACNGSVLQRQPWARPDEPSLSAIRAIQPAGRTRRPPIGCTRQTSDRQTSDSIIALCPLGGGISCVGGRHNMPPPPASWPFDLESGVWVTCDVAYLCANFSLPRPLCSTYAQCTRQTDVRHASSLSAPRSHTPF